LDLPVAFGDFNWLRTMQWTCIAKFVKLACKCFIELVPGGATGEEEDD